MMAHHDLPSEIKEPEIGKAQDRHLLFWNVLKSDQSFKSKGILEPKENPHQSHSSLLWTIQSHMIYALDEGQISELPPRIPDLELSETEDSFGINYPMERSKQNPLYLLCYQQQ